jgi:ribosome biogenesis SPOUT family RNA methylase Rps3
MQTTDDKEYEYLLFGGILGDEETIAMECLVP